MSGALRMMTASRPFSPRHIPEMRLWLKASDLALADGGQVSSWADRSAFAHTATQGTASLRPTYRANVVNGKPVVRFDGVDDYLQIPNHTGLQPLTGPWTVVFVAKRLGAGTGDVLQIIGSRPWSAALDKGWSVVVGGTAEPGKIMSHFADGSAGHDINSSSSGSPSTAVLSATAFEAWESHENRTTQQFYRNGALDISNNSNDVTGTINQTNPVYIGAEVEGSNNRRANIDLAEIVIYGKSLTAAERADLHAYFAKEFQV